MPTSTCQRRSTGRSDSVHSGLVARPPCPTTAAHKLSERGDASTGAAKAGMLTVRHRRYERWHAGARQMSMVIRCSARIWAATTTLATVRSRPEVVLVGRCEPICSRDASAAAISFHWIRASTAPVAAAPSTRTPTLAGLAQVLGTTPSRSTATAISDGETRSGHERAPELAASTRAVRGRSGCVAPRECRTVIRVRMQS